MKRKIFSVLFALMLVLSFSLVLAVPAAAAVGDPGSFNVAEFTLTGWGSGAAVWSPEEPHTGTYSAKLSTTTESWDDMAEVKVLYNGLLTTINADSDISYWIYTAGTQNPYAVLYLDTDSDGKIDHQLHSNRIGDITKNAWVNSAAGYQDTWILHAYDSNAPTGAQIGLAKTIAAWQTEYPNAEIIYVAIQYGDVANGVLYVDEITINDIIYDGLIQDAIDTITVTTLESGTTATAAWSGTKYHIGNYSAKLVDGLTTVVGSTVTYDEARVMVPYTGTLSNIAASLGAGYNYWVYAVDTTRLSPILYIDTDSSGEADVELSATNIGLTATGDWERTAPTSAGSNKWAAKRIVDNMWWDGDGWDELTAGSDTDSDGDTALYQPLANWNSGGGIDQADYVLYVGAMTTGSNGGTFYVDEITIGAVTYYTGDTINVAAGTYDDEVAWPITIDKAITIEGAGAATTIIDAGGARDAVHVTADGVTLQKFTITGIADSAENKLVDLTGVKGCTVTDNILTGPSTSPKPGDATTYGVLVMQPTAGEAAEGNTVTDNTISKVYFGIFTKETTEGSSYTTVSVNTLSTVCIGINAETSDSNTIASNQVTGATFAGISLFGADSNTVQYNTVTAGVDNDSGKDGAGIRLESTCKGNTISYNTITSNAGGGVLLDADANDGKDNVVNYNNISLNTGFGVQNEDVSNELDAENNWWGNASGPLCDTALYDIAYGDVVSDDVDYEPWLLAVVDIATPTTPTTYDKTLALKDGWTLVSTNKAVANTTSDAGTTSVLKYAVESGVLVWSTATVADDLAPVDALCIKTVGGGGVGIDYSANQPGVSSKTGGLLAGWNLISSGTEENAYNILSPLPYAEIGGAQAVGLTTLVSQDSYNQFSGNLYRATLQTSDWDALKAATLVPYDGYWIQMNAASDFGVITD